MNAVSDWIVFGAGSQGRVVLDILGSSGQNLRAFVDDVLALTSNSQVNGIPVWTRACFWEHFDPSRMSVFVAIGDNAQRRGIADELRRQGIRLGNVIHLSAQVMPSATLGTGVLLCPRSFVGVSAVIHDDAVLNTNCSVDHDCVIGRGAYLSPGVMTAGGVQVGQNVFVGLGAILGPRVHVGDAAVVGAGAVVLRSVPPLTLVAGGPARVRHRLQQPVDYKRLLAGTSEFLEVPDGC